MNPLRPAPAPAPGTITPAEAYDRARGGEAVLLDVREEHEFATGHPPNAVPLALSLLMAGAAVPAALYGERPVMSVCRFGTRSHLAARMLAERGITALNVVGGIQAWEEAGLPLVTGHASGVTTL